MNECCVLCGGEPRATPLFSPDINRRASDVVYRFSRCARCGTLQISNPPVNLDPYYDISYYALAEDSPTARAISKVDYFKLQLLQGACRPGDLLEVGPGAGDFLWLAKEAGFRPVAVERDKACREHLINSLGISAIDSSESLDGIASESFDCVALWHVFEHLRAPGLFLRGMHRVLRPGGIALMALPNPESLQFRLFGKYWVHLDPPRHLTHIPAEALKRVATDAGFEVQSLTYSDPATRYWNRFGWIHSTKNLPGPRALTPVYGVAGYALAAASYALGRFDPTRSAYTIALRRKI